jgi:hypothetical protein
VENLRVDNLLEKLRNLKSIAMLEGISRTTLKLEHKDEGQPIGSSAPQPECAVIGRDAN